MRVSDDLSDALVTMNFSASLFGKVTGESGKVFAKPLTGGGNR